MLIAVGGFLTFYAWSAARQAREVAAQSSSAAVAVEERFGIRVVLIEVTAGGGMIDFRYLVVDPDKAVHLREPENLPFLIAEDSGITIRVSALSDESDLEMERTYYLLYPNVRNAIKPGTKVTVVIGDLRLEHLTAQ